MNDIANLILLAGFVVLSSPFFIMSADPALVELQTPLILIGIGACGIGTGLFLVREWPLTAKEAVK